MKILAVGKILVRVVANSIGGPHPFQELDFISCRLFRPKSNVRDKAGKQMLLNLLLSGIELILIGRAAFAFIIRAAALDQHFDPGAKLAVLVYFRAQDFISGARAIEAEEIKIAAIGVLVFRIIDLHSALRTGGDRFRYVLDRHHLAQTVRDDLDFVAVAAAERHGGLAVDVPEHKSIEKDAGLREVALPPDVSVKVHDRGRVTVRSQQFKLAVGVTDDVPGGNRLLEIGADRFSADDIR